MFTEALLISPLAGAYPPNVVIDDIIVTAFAILTHAYTKIAIGISMPFATAMQGCITCCSPCSHRLCITAFA